MRGVNKVIILGNVGKEPSVKYLPSGGAVTNISVATSESWKDKNTGQVNEKTTDRIAHTGIAKADRHDAIKVKR